MPLQPLRIPSGWRINWNTFEEVEPCPENIHEFDGSSLLLLQNTSSNLLIDLMWRPERDLEGSFKINILPCEEVYNKSTHSFDYNGLWEVSLYTFSSKSRIEVVVKLEQLMLSFPPYKDPRILFKRGVVHQEAEQLRLALVEKGYSTTLAYQIVATKHAKLQDILLDHIQIPKAMVQVLAEKGATKGIRNKAQLKLKSKKFS